MWSRETGEWGEGGLLALGATSGHRLGFGPSSWPRNGWQQAGWDPADGFDDATHVTDCPTGSNLLGGWGLDLQSGLARTSAYTVWA